MFITAAIFIALVTATSGHKLPQVKQDNFLQNADTDTLIEVLAKLMRISDNHHKIEQVKQEQGKTIMYIIIQVQLTSGGHLPDITT